MSIDWGSFDLIYKSRDSSNVLEDFVEHIANRKLLYYKSIVHYGGKAGESLWTHVMNLVTTVEKVRSIFDLVTDEFCCLLLALVVHDLNKVAHYGKLPDGRNISYANATTRENLREELVALEVTPFFPEWESYLNDIKYLVDAHQEMSSQASQHDQVQIEQCKLAEERLEGPLKYLMKMADVADNSHSGEYATRDEKHIRDKLLQHLNAALNAAVHPRRFRFVGHRLAELRGIETNIIHNVIVDYMHETYGKDVCIDLLYHPEGVDYLLDRRVPFAWSPQIQRTIAELVGQKIARLQSDQLAQFIKAKPSGISVDDAAMQSGASLVVIFSHIRNIVERKQYKLEWREQRNAFARNDLETFITKQQTNAELQERVMLLLRETDLIPVEEEVLKRGEFAMAYRNFLKDHRGEQLKALKQDAWSRVSRLYQLATEQDALYSLIDPYRRGYFMARDLPANSLDAMMEAALADLEQLEEQALAVQAKRKRKKEQTEAILATETVTNSVTPLDNGYLVDYLERNLDVWDSIAPSPIQTINFTDSLRRYTDAKHPHTQCCYCGSPLKAEEWMALQVPRSIGVQNFSNRLEAGSSRDPKRNVCDICRNQFILEKLAWRTHDDKQGSKQLTFYLHLFPYSFFTQPMLLAWWQSIIRLRQGDHTSLFLDTRSYFTAWQDAYMGFQKGVRFFHKGLEGVSIPTFSEALSNTPVLPLIIGGSGYGQKFLVALEKAVLLALWFDCRLILSRLPTPLLNLTQERVGDEPVALLVENTPQALSWLLPDNTLTRQRVNRLCTTLRGLHQIASALTTDADDFYPVIYDLVVAASGDSLALYHEVDRLIEKYVAQKKSKYSDALAIDLSYKVAPLIKTLLEENKHD